MPPARRRDGIAVLHPASMLATWFGAGLLPKAPGTWGSLAALPFAWMMARTGGPWLLAGAAVVCFALGWWVSAIYVRLTGVDDPSEVVIDEVAAQWMVLVPVAPDPVAYLVGFAVFRVLDIVKPWPANWADRSVGGGLGVMLDDVLAGAWGIAAMVLFAHLTGN
ncbi:MAG: phosphatidylglycerophosphatase A [Actinomycetota bacterium]